MRETTVETLRGKLEGYSEKPSWEILSISQQQGQPDTWLVVVKDHRKPADRPHFADEAEPAAKEEESCRNCGDTECSNYGRNGEACGCYKPQEGGNE